jgi:hypothetical protein
MKVLRGKPILVCFVHHKSHIDWPEIELRPCGERLVTDCLSHGMAIKRALIE